MIDRIKKALELSGVNRYKIVENKADSVELFFIKKDLDMNRKKDVTQYEVVVYKRFKVDDTEYMGEASVKVYQTMTIEEMTELFRGALYAAGFVRNENYPLVSGGKEEFKTIYSNFSDYSLEEGAEKIREAIYKEDFYENGGINSCEIFLIKNRKRIINSQGLDVSYENYSSEIECITEWKENDEVEIFNLFKPTELNKEQLGMQVTNAIETAKWRDKAKETVDTGKYRVILSHDAVKEIFNYYNEMTDAQTIYDEISDFKVEDEIQGKEVKGDKITITLNPKTPYDRDGIKTRNITIIENGIVKAISGTQRFSSYIGVEPIGAVMDIKVSLGSKSLEEMKQGDYLHLTTFSGFEVNVVTGDFAGEIRLGFLCKDGVLTPITGGSVSGNIKDIQGDMVLSKDELKDSWYEGPLAIEIKDVNIAGK